MRMNSFSCPVRWLGVLMGLAALAPVQAQTMADPTRPAPAWLAAQPPVPGAAPVVAEPTSPDVQIVVIGPSRKFAMVNGKPMRQGEIYNGARLVGIDHKGVVWQRDGTKEKMSMSPAVEKKIAGAGPTTGRGKSGKPVVHGEDQ